MSTKQRMAPTMQTVCDLCDKEIVAGPSPREHGSLVGGYLSAPITRHTKRVWLLWPTPEWLRAARDRLGTALRYKERHYDFHAECIVALVESAVAAREAAARDERRSVGASA